MKKIDLGCGNAKCDKESIGVDIVKMPGVDVVCDINNEKLPFSDNELDEVYSRHLFEHLDNFFFVMKEVYRVLKPNGKLILKVPYFAAPTSYSDPTHKRFFGIYSFQCFDPSSGKHSYHQVGDTKFKLISVKYSFHYGFLSKFFEYFFNKSEKIQAKYERYLCYFIPAYDLKFILEPIK